MKKIFTLLLMIIQTAVFANSCISFMAPPATDYYSIKNGSLTATTDWSTVSHVSPSCTCAPTCNIPSNSVVYIKHIITVSCDIEIGSNSTIIVESGGALIVTGDGSITGTGNLQVDAGGSMSVSGNLNLSGNGEAIINGTLDVTGNITFSGSATLCGTGTINLGGNFEGGAPCGTLTLPVELIFFNAVANDEEVEINWQTASELNNDYFAIERSSNGKEFEEIMRVDGAGTTNQTIDYFERDYQPLPGTSYYRLRQVDFDGTPTLSNTVAVKRDNTLAEFSVYPNPVNEGDPFNLMFTGFGDEEVLVVVRDISGREFYSKVIITAADHQIIAFDPEQRIPAGTYLVIASSDDKLYTQKLIVK
ncbi:MAG: T9SS type A sorting domain-containing protein [Bacteroidota bacterium]